MASLSLRNPLCGALLQYPEEQMGIRYKRYEGEPVVITDVEAGHACERAGIPVGWAILAVDGFEVVDEESLQLALLQWRDRQVNERQRKHMCIAYGARQTCQTKQWPREYTNNNV